MEKRTVLLIALLGILSMQASMAQTAGYSIGDKAMEFTLPDVEGEEVSLSEEENGAIVVFTCNTCPFAVAYQDRLIALHEKYAPQGYPVIAINSNDANLSPGDSHDEMKKRAKEKKFPYPYVYDESQEVIKAYGATRTPQVYLVKKEDGKFVVKYIGAIDNNYQDAAAVTERYVEDAVEAVLVGKKVPVKTTKAIGCSIKWTKQSQ